MLGIFLLLFAVWAWFASRGTLLQFDELLEIAAATAPTTHDLLSSLASGVDFNPPLSHLVIRASVALFGAREWAMRLPAFLGVTVLLVCLYSFVARVFARRYGILAVLLMVALYIRDYAVQARPYGLVLGFSGLALLLYHFVTQPKYRLISLVGIAICSAGLVASHYYAVLVIGVFVIAEIVRFWESKRADWLLWACLIGPPLIVLFLLRGAIKQQRQVLTNYFARGNLLSFDHGYDPFAIDPLIYCVALALIAVVLYFAFLEGEIPLTSRIRLALKPKEMVLAISFLALPILGAFFTQFVTHAYVPRYFLPAAIGLVLCFCYITVFFSRLVPGLTLILIACLSLGFGKSMLQQAIKAPELLPALSDLAAENTPMLFDSPATYANTYYYFPSLRNNLWIIVDPVASYNYRHYDTDDKIMLALAAHSKGQAITLSAAARRWPQFRLVPRTADYIWALKCVIDAQSEIKVKHPFGSSNFIFDVAVSPQKLGQIDACESAK